MKLLFVIIILGLLIGITYAKKPQSDRKTDSIYNLEFKSINGDLISMREFKGKVVLVVNVASLCGFTSQYNKLQELYKKFNNKGFEIIAFPCNQFGNQEPGTPSEIKSFCERNYNISFLIADKIKVNGPLTHDIYNYFKALSNRNLNKKIRWNFTKFIIDKNGTVIDRFGPMQSPMSKSIINVIESAIKN